MSDQGCSAGLECAPALPLYDAPSPTWTPEHLNCVPAIDASGHRLEKERVHGDHELGLDLRRALQVVFGWYKCERFAECTGGRSLLNCQLRVSSLGHMLVEMCTHPQVKMLHANLIVRVGTRRRAPDFHLYTELELLTSLQP
jgi:hypothetical protein